MADRRRNRISDEARERIVWAYEEPTESTEAQQEALQIDDDMKTCLEGMINENRLLTLNQMNEELRRLPNKPHAHSTTISHALDGMLVSVKMTRRVPVEWSCRDIIEEGTNTQLVSWEKA